MSDLSDFGKDRSTTNNIPNSIRVEGESNQVICDNFGVAVNNVHGNVFINQPQPKFLSLHQLPADIADFTGRKAEINTIRQQLLGGRSLVISAVAGMPGVGKSALAIHVAQQLTKSDFPDVQLYVDLRGADGDALEPGMVLAQWLRAFGLDESMIPADLQERTRVYRSRLAGKRAIILLDNAKDEAQIRPLLPGSQTCVAIVTSRRLLGALEGATVLKLEVMLESDAKDLLEKFVGMNRLIAEPEAALEILQLCGGLPLAIRIVGGMLRSKVHWSLAEYSRKLADETQRLEHLQLSDLSVRASFELSYRELLAADSLLFSRLGILVGKDFGEELAGVVHGSDSPVIEGLERLIDAQLLEIDVDKRYYFHDLIRLFSREKSSTCNSLEKQKEIKNKIIDWGYTKSSVMNYFLRPGEIHQKGFGLIRKDSDPPEMEWFEQEYENLLGIINLSKEIQRLDIIAPFVANLIFFFEARNRLTDWQKACELAVEAARQIGDIKKESQSFVGLGLMYIRWHKWDKAINCYEKSLAIQRKSSDLNGQSQSLNNLGMIYQSQNKWDKAIECCLEDLDICRQTGDLYGESKSVHNLGNVYNSLHQWDKAIKCYSESLSIKRRLGDRNGEGGTLNNLGLVYESIGQWDEAIVFYNQSLVIFQELRDIWRESMCLNNLGLIYQHQCQWSKSVECYQKALGIQEKLDDKHGVSTSLSNLAVTYQFQELLDDALECHHRNLIICQELGDQPRVGQISSNIGELYYCKNQLDKAIEYYNYSLCIFRDLSDLYEEGLIAINLGNIYTSEELYDEAIECFQSSLAIFQNSDVYWEGQVLAAIGSLYKQLGQRNLAIAFWRNSLSKLPEDSGEYQIVRRWLKNTEILFQQILLLSMFVILGSSILGQHVITLIALALGFVIVLWLLFYLLRK